MRLEDQKVPGLTWTPRLERRAYNRNAVSDVSAHAQLRSFNPRKALKWSIFDVIRMRSFTWAIAAI